jgi:iron complex outermembrane receptor protein
MFKTKYITLLLFSFLIGGTIWAQEVQTNNLTKEKILQMTTEELSALSLEDLMAAIDIVGVSSLEELYELLLNKDVTSASKSEESLFDSPLSTTVLSHDQIIASGATSIEEALRLVPGVIVREKTNGNYDVHIRGNDNLPAKNMLLYSENMNTLVMINGRPVFNYSHGGTLWETLPVSFEDIDRIEVVRGSSSALYGPNALSGVINIITQNITKDSPLFSGNVQAGSLSTYLGDVAFRKQLNDKLSVGLTANMETRDRERDDILIYDRGGANYTLHNDPEDLNDLGTPQKPGYFSRDEINRMRNGDKRLWPTYKVKGKDYNIFRSFPDPGKAKERYGVNGYLNFSPQEHTSIDVMAGFQDSKAITSSMGDEPTPYTTKQASTGYFDVRAKVKDFSFQANYNFGTIDYMSGNEGFELDNDQFNIQAEYDWRLGKINIRPGISYQSMAYDDSEHISEVGKGYLNKEQVINILAGSARVDYRPTDKLRLVAALRTEKYNNPDDLYTSWQFISSYKFNDNTLLRAVYSRANQSSFLVNTYSNYTWNVVNMEFPKMMHFNGDKNHDLKIMDMIELGFRTRPSKSILLDLEAFYNTSEDFGALMPSHTTINIYNAASYLMDPENTALAVAPEVVTVSYQNLPLKSKQMGISASIDWVINEKLVANGHVTIQKTKLDNYLEYSRNDMIAHLTQDAATKSLGALGQQLGSGQMTFDQIPAVVTGESSSMPTVAKDDVTNEATPSYFGGFSLTYRPCKKLEIFPQAYFYGEQTFINQYATEEIKGKFLLNTKVSYKATDKLTLFVNGRNILNMKDREFAFMDEVPGMVLGGLNFKF